MHINTVSLPIQAEPAESIRQRRAVNRLSAKKHRPDRAMCVDAMSLTRHEFTTFAVHNIDFAIEAATVAPSLAPLERDTSGLQTKTRSRQEIVTTRETARARAIATPCCARGMSQGSDVTLMSSAEDEIRSCERGRGQVVI